MEWDSIRQLAADIFSNGDGTREDADTQAKNFAALLEYLGEEEIENMGGRNEVWVWFVNSEQSVSDEFDPAEFCGNK